VDKKYKQISQTLNDQSAAITKLTGSSLGGEDEAVVPGLDADVVARQARRDGLHMSEEVDRERSRKYPDWKAATAPSRNIFSGSAKRGRDRAAICKNKDSKRFPSLSASTSPTAFQSTRDQERRDDLVDRSKKLGELKVDHFERR